MVPTHDQKRSRWPTSAWWKVVQSVTFEQSDAKPGIKQHACRFHEKRMVSTILRYIESYTAWQAMRREATDIEDTYAAVHEVLNRVEEHYNEKESSFEEEVRAKLLKIRRDLDKGQAN